MRILIIDNQPIARTGFRLLIEDGLGEVQIDTIDHLGQMSALFSYEAYNLVLLTIEDIDQSQLDFVAMLRNQHPHVPVVICSRVASLSNALKYYQHGANCVLTLQSTDKEIMLCINSALSGGRFISSDLLDEMLDRRFGYKRNKGAVEKLSRREQEIAKMLISGKRSSDIASLLRLSMTTVSTFKGKIFRKTGVDNIIDLKEKLAPILPSMV